MDAEGDRSPQDEQTQVEYAVLQAILELHPDHLTPSELAREVAVDPRSHSEDETVMHAIRDLSRSGVLRYVGEVVAPTHATLRAVRLLVQS